MKNDIQPNLQFMEISVKGSVIFFCENEYLVQHLKLQTYLQEVKKNKKKKIKRTLRKTQKRKVHNQMEKLKAQNTSHEWIETVYS